jgi:hypothetical protein
MVEHIQISILRGKMPLPLKNRRTLGHRIEWLKFRAGCLLLKTVGQRQLSARPVVFARRMLRTVTLPSMARPPEVRALVWSRKTSFS